MHWHIYACKHMYAYICMHMYAWIRTHAYACMHANVSQIGDGVRLCIMSLFALVT